MKTPRLVSIGDLMLDVVVRLDAGLEAASDAPGSVRFRLGGSAGNTCRAFVALGGRAAFIGAVGSDSLGKRLGQALRGAGVSTHLVSVPGSTPRLAALVGAGGERSFVTDRGVADSLTPADLHRRWFARADALHLPAYSLLSPPLSDASLQAAALVRARGGLVSVDLASRAPLLAAGPDAALQAVRAASPDVLLANRDEVAALVGRRGVRGLLSVAPLVVVKLGPSGCQLVWHDARSVTISRMEVATRPLAATDTTGAGDAFDAGFLYSLLQSGLRGGETPSATAMRRAALVGHRAAARVLTRPRIELGL